MPGPGPAPIRADAGPIAGIHPAEWGSELLGTACLILGGLSAVCLDFGRGTPLPHLLPSASWRLLLTGLLFGGTGSLIAVTPVGRRSGAHLNPCVTLAFFVTGHVHRDDLLGYALAQVGGAAAAAVLVARLWGGAARSVADGVTRPGPGTGALAAVGIEALMTAILVATILLCVSHRRSVRWTPLAVWVVVALLVRFGAPYTGTSLNPARSLGPALVAGQLGGLWIYWVGPPAGALAAVALFRLLGRGRRPLTAKLFHDVRYPSVLRSRLATAGGRDPGRDQIEATGR